MSPSIRLTRPEDNSWRCEALMWPWTHRQCLWNCRCPSESEENSFFERIWLHWSRGVVFVFRKHSLSAKPYVVRLVMRLVSALIKLFKAHFYQRDNDTLVNVIKSTFPSLLTKLNPSTWPLRTPHGSLIQYQQLCTKKHQGVIGEIWFYWGRLHIQKSRPGGHQRYLQRNTRVRFTSDSCKWLCKSVTVDLVQDKVAVNLAVSLVWLNLEFVKWINLCHLIKRLGHLVRCSLDGFMLTTLNRNTAIKSDIRSDDKTRKAQ